MRFRLKPHLRHPDGLVARASECAESRGPDWTSTHEKSKMDEHCELSLRSCQPAFPGKVDRSGKVFSLTAADVEATRVSVSFGRDRRGLNQAGGSMPSFKQMPSGSLRDWSEQAAHSVRHVQHAPQPALAMARGKSWQSGAWALEQVGQALTHSGDVRAATALPPELVQAYLETRYRVDGVRDARHQRLRVDGALSGSLILQIGQHSEGLLAWFREAHVDCAAYVTACNPWSRELSAQENEERMQELKAELSHRSLRFLSGQGVHPSNGWSAESSVLVLGLSREAARRLGERWQQNAIVWIGADAIPELMLLR